MDSIGEPVVVWIVLAILAGVVEVSVPHFGVMFVSVGAMAGALAAVVGLGPVVQVVAFVVVLAGSLAVLRPRLVSRIGAAQGVPSRTEALVGRDGVVTADINPVIGTGRVNVGGEDWAGRSGAPLAAGTRVRVVGADGIVLEVTPI